MFVWERWQKGAYCVCVCVCVYYVEWATHISSHFSKREILPQSYLSWSSSFRKRVRFEINQSQLHSCGGYTAEKTPSPSFPPQGGHLHICTHTSVCTHCRRQFSSHRLPTVDVLCPWLQQPYLFLPITPAPSRLGGWVLLESGGSL